MRREAYRAWLVPILLVATSSWTLSQTLVHRLNGSAPGDRAGVVVGGGFDVDGDGIPDLIVGVPLSDAGASNSGAARVFSGASGELIYQVDIDQGSARFGAAVAIVGDLNGDSRAEFLVGGPLYNVHGTDCGRAWLYSGLTGEPIADFSGS